MCGIFGIIFPAATSPLPDIVINNIKRSLAHRGPDNSGYFYSSQVQFIHQRLSIVDLRNVANQPLTINWHNLCATIIFNGEIYNYQSLRMQLERKQHHFISRSDTEVILHAYLEWGEEFLKKIEGMFALAIFDKTTNSVIIARDRFGIKPLYYTQVSGKIIFASTIKSIQLVTNQYSLDTNILKLILQFRYNPIMPTVFKGITKLTPGKYIKITKDGIRTFTYWTINTISSNTNHRSLASLLSSSVHQHLQGDATGGIFLSGGIDSSIIATIAHTKKQLLAYTYDFKHQPAEQFYATQLCTKLHFPHKQQVLQPNDYLTYPQIINTFDEPILDSIILPTFQLAQLASKKCKFVLTGEGADELFGGYVHHYVIYYTSLLLSLFPFIKRNNILQLINKIPLKFWNIFFPYPGKLTQEGVNKLIKFLHYQEAPIKAYLTLVKLFPTQNDDDLNFIPPNKGHALPPAEIIKNIILFDFQHWLPNYTLSRLDTLTMATSLEARVPFLDHTLVEKSINLGVSKNFTIWQQKQLLRKAIYNNVADIPIALIRRRKYPFHLPTNNTFDHNFASFRNQQINHPILREINNKISYQLNQNDLLSNKRKDALMLLSLWLQEHS